MFERVFHHRLILADQVRIEAYRKAIHEVVKKEDVVADIGTGSGILAFFAIQAGARKVYAIEQDKIIEETKKLAKINGLEKKIVFVEGRSDRVELPERVDVITSELIGFFGLEENLLHFKIDARKRFLKPGGRLVPSWLELYLVPVESEAVWKDMIGFWSSGYYGFDFSPVRDYAVSQKYVMDCSGKVNHLAPPSMISHLDFYRIEKVPFVFQGEFIIDKKGTLHGLVGYFRSGLSPTVGLSTSPEKPLTHWEQTFFPMGDVVMVEEDDTVRYKIKVIPHMNTMFWQWDTSIYRNGTKVTEFSQSNLHFSKKDLVIGRTSFRPVLTQEGEIRRRVLDLCDCRRSIGEISEFIWTEYPEKYGSLKDAIQDVVGVLRPVVRVQ